MGGKGGVRMGVKVRERKGMYRYLAVGLLILLFHISMAASGFGGQFEDATAAYERGDYATAFRLMKPLAEKGDAKAQHNLGVMYDYGRGGEVVPKGRCAGTPRSPVQPRQHVLQRPRRSAGLHPGSYVAQPCGFTVPCISKKGSE